MLVLGATGAIGAHVARACLARGWEVRALVRAASRREDLAGLELELVDGDVREPRTLAAAFSGCDAFVHAAGFYPTSDLSPARAVEIGLASVRDVFEAAAAEGVGRGVYVSSASTIAGDREQGAAGAAQRPSALPPAPDPPASQRTPAGPYGRAKEAMERLARARAAHGLPLVIVNPTLCLGEYGRKPSSGRLVLEVARGRVPFYVEAPVNVVYTGDVGRGIAAALSDGRVGERYVLAGNDTTFGWLVRQIAYEAGARAPRVRAPLALARAGARLSDAVARARGEPAFARVGIELLGASRRFDGSAARRALGLPEPTPAVETVRRAVRWLRAVGMLAGVP